MASTLTKMLLHITFSTKHREPMLPRPLEPDLYAYVGGICRRMNSPLLAMGGVADHVHVMVNLAKTVALSDLMLNIKRDSSKWISLHAPEIGSFHWQDGYFAFSIGESGADALRHYINTQPEHHQATSFQDEVRTLLTKYGIEWDESHIWT